MFVSLLSARPVAALVPGAAAQFRRDLAIFPGAAARGRDWQDEGFAAHGLGRRDGDGQILLHSGSLGPDQLEPNCLLADAGTGWLERLRGDFAFALVDLKRRRMDLARDPVGARPLFYRVGPDWIAAASTAAALKAIGGPATPDPAWIARYSWMNLSEDFTRTAYREIIKVPPGHLLEVTLGEVPRIRRWHHWHNDPVGAAQPPGEGTVTAYRTELVSAVTARLGAERPVAFEASGGLDSSSVAAAALHSGSLLPDQLCALGYALSEDEPAAIATLTGALGLTCRRIYRSPDPVGAEQVDRALAALGYPEENSIASSYWRLHQDAAALGVRRLLSGFGGDEAVSNPAFQARQEWRAGGQLRTLHASFAGGFWRRSARFTRFMLGGSGESAPQAFRRAWEARWPHTLLTEAAAQEFGVADAYFATAEYGTGIDRVNAMVIDHHLGSPGLSTRLENCVLIGASFGLEYTWPLLDARLVQTYLDAPTTAKFGPGDQGRYLHRRAVAPWLPAEIAWRRDKWMGPLRQTPIASGLPISEWATPDLATPLVGLIDPAKVERAMVTVRRAETLDDGVIAARSSLARLAWLNRWLVA